MAISAASLGSLERLPLEIRQMIYANCQTSSEEPRSAQMLRVNTTAYSEFLESMQRVWKFGILRLHIDPSKHPSTVQILTDYGRTLGSINAASSHLQFDTNPIRNMPIGRYEWIRLNIIAPNPRDPGQAIRLCKQVSAVVTSLSSCWFPSTTLGIPSQITDCLFPQQMKVSPPFVTKLYVKFKESSQRSWYLNGKLQKSLTGYDEGWYDERLAYTGGCNTDMSLVLQILGQVRSMPVWIDRPITDARVDEHLKRLMNKVRILSRLETHFGLNWRHTYVKLPKHRALSDDSYFKYSTYEIPDAYFKFSDHKILAKIHSLQIWQEYLLDDLPGRSADLLRQERFLNWCNAYERQHAKALDGIPPRLMSEEDRYPKRPCMPIARAYEWIDVDLFGLIESSFHSRFWAMMSCDTSKPTGVERKSKNKLWTEFPERPMVKLHALLGFRVSTDEKHSRVGRWRQASTDCIVCKAEAERNRRVFAQKSVQRMLQVLSSSSGLED